MILNILKNELEVSRLIPINPKQLLLYNFNTYPKLRPSIFQVMVNEAAAQICRCVPALLTRRDELFPLARQLVRRAGLHYSKHG